MIFYLYSLPSIVVTRNSPETMNLNFVRIIFVHYILSINKKQNTRTYTHIYAQSLFFLEFYIVRRIMCFKFDRVKKILRLTNVFFCERAPHRENAKKKKKIYKTVISKIPAFRFGVSRQYF